MHLIFAQARPSESILITKYSRFTVLFNTSTMACTAHSCLHHNIANLQLETFQGSIVLNTLYIINCQTSLINKGTNINQCIIGVSLSKPHTNSTVSCEYLYTKYTICQSFLSYAPPSAGHSVHASFNIHLLANLPLCL